MDSSPAIDATQLADLLKTPREVYKVCGPVPEGVPRLVRRMLAFIRDGLSLPEVCQEIDLPISKGRAVVGRLQSLGILAVRVPDPVDSFFEEPFDEVEQEFFASDVQPIDECDEPFPKLGDKMRSFFDRLKRR
jgi:hypothetical protein